MFTLGYKEVSGKFYPIIELVIEHNGKKIETSAILDSGATVSVFNGRVAEDLKLNIESGEKRIFQSATAKLVAYIHELSMKIEDYKFPCKIAFSNDLSTSFNLLGRETVFDKFLITFNEKEKEILLERVD